MRYWDTLATNIPITLIYSVLHRDCSLCEASKVGANYTGVAFVTNHLTVRNIRFSSEI
jgi:hypothetical protein